MTGGAVSSSHKQNLVYSGPGSVDWCHSCTTMAAPEINRELKRLRMDTVGLSEMKKPNSGKTSSAGYSCYWSDLSDGTLFRGVL